MYSVRGVKWCYRCEKVAGEQGCCVTVTDKIRLFHRRIFIHIYPDLTP